ncbi:DUF423 domain-containing protein [Candidatus Litorirhabdus singularis]|nr:DUF423 domain-containing protein [Candidatus Litorirhabdus singularis]
MGRLFIMLAASSGLLAVAFGAFGAHALKGRLDNYALGVYQTAVDYHITHSLALLAVGLMCLWYPQASLLRLSGIAFAVGILIFSGTLYVLALSGLKWLGAVTPLGGLALMLGWGALAVAAWRLPAQ